MKKFQFRLATLVRLREAVRDQRHSELADALRVQEALELQMRELTAELEATRRSQAVAPGKVDVDRLLAAQRYEINLLVDQRKLAQQQANVAIEVDKRREALVLADQDVRVLEKLRETQHARWRAEDERRVMHELDEVAGRARTDEAFG